MSQKANLSLIKKLVEENKTVKEISLKSGYSEGTVRKHIKEMGLKVFLKEPT